MSVLQVGWKLNPVFTVQPHQWCVQGTTTNLLLQTTLLLIQIARFDLASQTFRVLCCHLQWIQFPPEALSYHSPLTYYCCSSYCSSIPMHVGYAWKEDLEIKLHLGAFLQFIKSIHETPLSNKLCFHWFRSMGKGTHQRALCRWYTQSVMSQVIPGNTVSLFVDQNSPIAMQSVSHLKS